MRISVNFTDVMSITIKHHGNYYKVALKYTFVCGNYITGDLH